MTIPILYEDDDLLIVNKPAELLTVPGRGADKQDCLINRIKRNEPNARIIHRLDMSTSGIVIIAKHHEAQVAMGHLFEQRNIQKNYIAVVGGELKEQKGRVDLPLICDWPNRPKQKVDHTEGKPAQTDFESLGFEPTKNQTRVALKPITGRSHQLRVHMLAIGHPIVGDNLYAPEPIKAQSSRLLLHASEIAFIQPLSQTKLHICSEPPF